MKRISYGTIGGRDEERPRCLACGTLIDAEPEAESMKRRGAYAVHVSWRVCPCGAFARTQRVSKLHLVEAAPDQRPGHVRSA